MQIPVLLGGHRLLWTFRDSARLGDWLGTRPWLSGGGLAAVRCGGPAAGQALAAALHREVLTADAGASRPCVLPWSVAADAAGGCLGNLGEALGLSAVPGRVRETAARFGEVLRANPVILVGHLGDNGLDAGRLLTEASELLDQLSKLPARPALTLLLLTDGHAFANAPATFDFEVGAPVEPALTTLGAPEAVRWAAYLHYRLAWESAGNLERALFMAAAPEVGALSSRRGDDSSLEAALGLLADRLLAAHDVATRMAWLDYAHRPASPYPANCPGLWVPVAGDDPRPEPFLARALLRSGASGRARWRLRDSLACRPLATELLMRCLDLEARLRADHARELIAGLGSAGKRCTEQHARYAAGGMSAVEYPAGHPSPPLRAEDVWLFASLGEVVECLDAGLSDGASRSYRELVSLRNAVAHGHHVGWKQWQVLRRLSGLGP